MQSQNGKIMGETRGRPKKEETRVLDPVYKQIFSENTAVIHTSFLIYVFEVFYETKTEKRVGHKDGGFTIYDKIDAEYCFDDVEKRIKEWKYLHLLEQDRMESFIRVLPAVGPKLILKQILKLLNEIVVMAEDHKSEKQILFSLTEGKPHEELDEEYPHMRFVPCVLRQLKLEKIDKEAKSIVDIVKERVRSLWTPLLTITIHAILNCIEGVVVNKYFRFFFSDADKNVQTHIGQLNIDQIVAAAELIDAKQETEQRNGKRSSNGYDTGEKKKIRQVVDSEGHKHIVQIIKKPEQEENGFRSPTRIHSDRSTSLINSQLVNALIESVQREQEKDEEERQKKVEQKQSIRDEDPQEQVDVEVEKEGEEGVEGDEQQDFQIREDPEGGNSKNVQ